MDRQCVCVQTGPAVGVRGLDGAAGEAPGRRAARSVARVQTCVCLKMSILPRLVVCSILCHQKCATEDVVTWHWQL
jgi:hypothetical protein